MKELLKIYSGFLISCLLIPIGCGLLFGTVVYTMPTYGSDVEPIWTDCFLIVFKFSELIWLGIVFLFVGLNYMTGNTESKELTRNIKNAFKTKNHGKG